MGRRPRGLVAAALVTAIAAWAGVVGLATGALDLTPPVEHRLPFHSPVLGAVALAVVVAGPCSFAAIFSRGGVMPGPASLPSSRGGSSLAGSSWRSV